MQSFSYSAKPTSDSSIAELVGGSLIAIFALFGIVVLTFVVVDQFTGNDIAILDASDLRQENQDLEWIIASQEQDIRYLAAQLQDASCPQEDMAKVPVHYPEGPYECVQVDEIENANSQKFMCPNGRPARQQSEASIMTSDGRQHYIASILCES